MSSNQANRSFWKNSEDQTLKAFVMKYGTNNWSRISSVIRWKTPQQCKARWFEYLDPAIRRDGWTKEEDERLVKYIRIFPQQWRTIAETLGNGRTTTQCIQRYEELLDAADDRQKDGETEEKGTRDLQPHTCAPLKDTVDKDQEEEEMLAEARARLANVQGKKQKRKIREAMIDEARTASAVQKMREARRAGLETTLIQKTPQRTYIDFTKDEMQAPTDPRMLAEWKRAQALEKSARGPLDVTKLEGRTVAEIEAEKRRKDKEKNEKRKREDIESHYERLDVRVGSGASADLLGPLSLPAPSTTVTTGIHRLTMAAQLAASKVMADRVSPLESISGQPLSSSVAQVERPAINSNPNQRKDIVLDFTALPAPVSEYALADGDRLVRSYQQRDAPKAQGEAPTAQTVNSSNQGLPFNAFASGLTPEDMVRLEMENPTVMCPMTEPIAGGRWETDEGWRSVTVEPLTHIPKSSLNIDHVAASLEMLRAYNNKLESRVRLYMAGYESKSAEAALKLVASHTELEKQSRNLRLYQTMYEEEERGARFRIETEKRFLLAARDTEELLQRQYEAVKYR